MHTLCAETRDTLLYVYIHAWVARIHAHTCIPTRAWYAYIVRAETRDTLLYVYIHAWVARIHAHTCIPTRA
jgi:hypothetical protein